MIVKAAYVSQWLCELMLACGLNADGIYFQAQVFCWKDSSAHEEMRKACFDYLKLGGMHADGPMSLLSGLRPQPSILVMHFFMVALFGVGRLIMPFPTPS